jgi:hypothetical protein
MVNKYPVTVKQHRIFDIVVPPKFHNLALENPHLKANFTFNRAGLNVIAGVSI